MTFKSILVTQRGGPEALRIIDNELRQPAPGKARVRTLACCVCLPDVQARYGHTPIAPKVPFVPGYAITGIVDAVGEGVTTFAPDDPVAALLVFGGYAEYVYLDAERLVPMPESVDPAQAVTLVLNYIVAYQTMHRSAKVEPGDTVLIIGASGGVGTACLDVGRLAGLQMYGVASRAKHTILERFGATPIDYHTQDYVDFMREAEPGGLDAVFDGMGAEHVDRGVSLLKSGSVLARGGTLVSYGNPLTLRGLLSLLGKVVWYSLLPNGKRVKVYGTTASKFGRQRFVDDWATLFGLLEEGRIEPVIMQRFPLLEAAQANALLESGQVVGNLVLVAPELLHTP